MASVPTPPTQAASSVVTSTNLNLIRDALQFLLGSTMTGSGGGRRALARVRNAASVSLTSGVNTAIPMETEDVDYDNGHSTVTNNSRYTAQTAGWYTASGQAQFATNATGVRLVYLAVNGTERVGTRVEVQAITVGGIGTVIASPTDLIFLNVGDFIELWGQQTSGGALNVSSAMLCVELSSN